MKREVWKHFTAEQLIACDGVFTVRALSLLLLSPSSISVIRERSLESSASATTTLCPAERNVHTVVEFMIYYSHIFKTLHLKIICRAVNFMKLANKFSLGGLINSDPSKNKNTKKTTPFFVGFFLTKRTEK